jgi:IS30 family transposase
MGSRHETPAGRLLPTAANLAKHSNENLPTTKPLQVSHETIYQTLYVMPRNYQPQAVLVADALRQHHAETASAESARQA